MKYLFFCFLFLPFAVFSQQAPPKLLSQSIRAYDTATGLVIKTDTIDYSYSTGGGDPYVYLPHQYDSSTWLIKTTGSFENYSRRYQTYTGKHDVALYTEYWDANNMQWKPPVKYEILYDTNGNQIAFKNNKLVNGLWELVQEDTRSFDANNNLVFAQTKRYNNAPGTADSSRFIYYYSGKVYDSSVYQIYNMGWRDTSKQLFEHVSANYSIQWGLQKKNTVWDTVAKLHRYYNTNRLMQHYIVDNNTPVSGGGKQWKPVQAYYYTYDSKGNLLTDSVLKAYLFSPKPDTFYNNYKRTFSYNKFGQKLTEAYYWNDTASNAWLLNSEINYHYSEDTTRDTTTSVDRMTAMDIVVYPNPARNELRVTGEVGSEYVIYNIEGKRVSVGMNTGVINVSKLEAGSYILNLRGVRPIVFIKE